MTHRGTMTLVAMSDGASIGVYHVEPKGDRKGGLVLIQEIFGVTDHIKELCDGYAEDGYEVLAPALYDRVAPNFQATYDPEDIQKAIKVARELHSFPQAMEDVQTCIQALKVKGKVFITGYCYGGSMAWAMACRSPDLAAASGGNCPLTESDRTVVKHGVTLVGETNLPALVAADASALYARNVLDFLKLVLGKDGGLQVDLNDDIVAACLMTQGGEVKRK